MDSDQGIAGPSVDCIRPDVWQYGRFSSDKSWKCVASSRFGIVRPAFAAAFSCSSFSCSSSPLITACAARTRSVAFGEPGDSANSAASNGGEDQRGAGRVVFALDRAVVDSLLLDCG